MENDLLSFLNPRSSIFNPPSSIFSPHLPSSILGAQTLRDQGIYTRVKHEPHVRARHFKVCRRIISYADTPVNHSIALCVYSRLHDRGREAALYGGHGSTATVASVTIRLETAILTADSLATPLTCRQ